MIEATPISSKILKEPIFNHVRCVTCNVKDPKFSVAILRHNYDLNSLFYYVCGNPNCLTLLKLKYAEYL